MKTQSKFKDFAALAKLRLSFLVVVSAVSGFLFADGKFDIVLVYLILGGFLITGSSNAFNQIIERDIDKKMPRTANRPLPTNRMSVTTALLLAFGMGIVGAILLFQINFYSGILGLLSLFIYVFLYTPLKRISPWAVFVGAIPGAIPPMLGVVAVDNSFSQIAGIMFFFQFVWQFPHFWAIAWVVDEDYKKGGFSLLPSKGRKNHTSALIILISSILLVPTGVLPYIYNYTGLASLIIGLIAGGWFLWLTIKLYIHQDDKSAKKLMFASFIYLPIIQFLYVFNQV
ncbi:protoheme IX farnesyltransferase [Putridiphycobacter roseus]|uniref:Protoheme IX farnesyltransferase n=1 Tax=Putridiphycobacter roseus TaxID=2219161 RepID=A0A2W1N0C5_9FLAO|nr:protoheme IX farnesyltransferase [Putridiphycobacter roseus]